MAGKLIKIRLYRIQDYDLYCLHFDPIFNLPEAFRLAVTAYAEGLPTPSIDVRYVRDLPQGKPISVEISFRLQSQKAIELLVAASQHGRNANNFAKNILRRSLMGIEKLYLNPTSFDAAAVTTAGEVQEADRNDKHIYKRNIPPKQVSKESVSGHKESLPNENDAKISQGEKTALNEAGEAIKEPVSCDGTSEIKSKLMKENTSQDATVNSDDELFNFIESLMDGF